MTTVTASMPRNPRLRVYTPQLLKALLVASLAVPALIFAVHAWLSYVDVFRDAELRARHISSILQEHATKVFETIGLALRQTEQRLKGLDADTIRTSRPLWEELQKLQSANEQLGSIFVLAPDGSLLLTTRVFPTPATNFADRDYFVAQRDGDAGLYLGRSYMGKISEAPIFNFSIRRSRPDGSFDGVIGSSAFVDYFQRFYSTVGAEGDNSSVVLVHDDGDILARYPPVPPGERFITARKFVNSMRDRSQDVMYGTSPIDGRDRLLGITRLRHFPAYVIYTIDRASIRRDWYERVALSGSVAAVFAAVLFIITSFALRRATTEAAALQRLQETSTSLRDEVERRERAEASLLQAQRLDAVGRLTGGIAHDFNNLLQIISGNLEIAQRRSDLASIKRVLTSAQYAAQRGSDLTRRLLAFSRQQALHPETVDLNDILDKARIWVGRTISDAIEIRLHCVDGVWPVRVDVAQLEAALLNLVVNARDAMPEGGVLTLETHNEELDPAKIVAGNLDVPAGPYVRLAVTDSGSGILPDVLTRIYEPFFTTKEVGKGSGLGLSQVYGFVRQSGGAVAIGSELGRGTVVSLYLPRCDRIDADDGARIEVAAQADDAGGRVVLVVEDNDDVRRISAAMLDELGYSTITARNGIEALALLSAGEPINVLFSDIFMPRAMSGIRLAEEATALRPNLKVLLTTASLDADTTFPLLRKPYTQAELGEKMRQVLG